MFENKNNPYEILNIEPGATREEIHRAYKKTLAQYHPDKVEHLGEDIRALARDKTRAIQQAYDELSK